MSQLRKPLVAGSAAVLLAAGAVAFTLAGSSGHSAAGSHPAVKHSAVKTASPAKVKSAQLADSACTGPAGTAFIAWARHHGCRRSAQGWGMLVEQAAESFELWRGLRPLTAPVLDALIAGA